LLNYLKKNWLFNIRGDVLAGITVALALIPESIAFSIIAGVDPMVGIHASFCIAVLISIVGGRPGMISAATGAMSILMVTLVAKHGIEYLYAATVLTGIIQYAIGVLRLGKWISFIPQTVLSGFLNALGIMVFISQLQHFIHESWLIYMIVVVTLIIVYGLPRLTKIVPSPLVAIVVMTIVTIVAGIQVKTVGDMGAITSQFPLFHIPQVLFNWDTLMIILPVSLTMAVVGLLETLITATILDEKTATKSNKNKEVRGQGIANTVTGFFGGMAGCAMIGQSLINIRSGGRGRLSTMVAGAVLLLLIMLLRDVVLQIPMPALAGVMIMVAISTFDIESIKRIHRTPIGDTIVMVATVVVILVTHDLAKGVLVGILLSAVMFAWKAAHIQVTSEITDTGSKVYYIQGPLFFATANAFQDVFDPMNDPPVSIVNASRTKVWDQSALQSLEKVIKQYEELGKSLTIIQLDYDSRKMIHKAGITVQSD